MACVRGDPGTLGTDGAAKQGSRLFSVLDSLCSLLIHGAMLLDPQSVLVLVVVVSCLVDRQGRGISLSRSPKESAAKPEDAVSYPLAWQSLALPLSHLSFSVALSFSLPFRWPLLQWNLDRGP